MMTAGVNRTRLLFFIAVMSVAQYAIAFLPYQAQATVAIGPGNKLLQKVHIHDVDYRYYKVVKVPSGYYETYDGEHITRFHPNVINPIIQQHRRVVVPEADQPSDEPLSYGNRAITATYTVDAVVRDGQSELGL